MARIVSENSEFRSDDGDSLLRLAGGPWRARAQPPELTLLPVPLPVHPDTPDQSPHEALPGSLSSTCWCGVAPLGTPWSEPSAVQGERGQGAGRGLSCTARSRTLTVRQRHRRRFRLPASATAPQGTTRLQVPIPAQGFPPVKWTGPESFCFACEEVGEAVLRKKALPFESRKYTAQASGGIAAPNREGRVAPS